MGCGESKHAVATTEPIKKSASRSSSRRIEDPEQDKTTTTTTATTTTDIVENGKAGAIDGNKNGERPVGVIPSEPFIYQKPPMGTANAAKKGVIVGASKAGGRVKEERKKLVVVVGHDRTASKESQVSDYFSEDGKSEYESPQQDDARGSNVEAASMVAIEKTKEKGHGKKKNVVVVEEYTKTKMVEEKEQKNEKQEEMKQEQVKIEEARVIQKEGDQVVLPLQVEEGTPMATKKKGDPESAHDSVVVAEQDSMKDKTTMVESVDEEIKTMEIRPDVVEVGSVYEEKIKETDA